jgi:hypothetical protein
MRRSRWAPRAHQKPRPRRVSRQQKWLVKQVKQLMDRYRIELRDGTNVIIEYTDETVIIF